jgi:DUF1009 family protein
MEPKLAIVAGGGDLPWLLREACRIVGRDSLFLALTGEVDEDRLPEPDTWLNLGSWGKNLDFLRANEIEELVFAGSVRRPDLKNLNPDSRGIGFLAKLGIAWLGDNSILTSVLKELEQEGFRVISPESLLDNLLSKEGTYGQKVPSEADWKDIRRGMNVISAIGGQDIGQAVVIQQGIVLAVEAAEGTDEMIRRCKRLGEQGTGGVLVKFPKPGQDRRVDLPTIGVGTVEMVKQAGLAGIAVEVGGALIIGPEETTCSADEAGVFLVGVKGD